MFKHKFIFNPLKQYFLDVMKMPETCPDCEIEMKEYIKKCFGNPVNINVEIPVEVCPKCGFIRFKYVVFRIAMVPGA